VVTVQFNAVACKTDPIFTQNGRRVSLQDNKLTFRAAKTVRVAMESSSSPCYATVASISVVRDNTQSANSMPRSRSSTN
jgi:hypothetical protein